MSSQDLAASHGNERGQLLHTAINHWEVFDAETFVSSPSKSWVSLGVLKIAQVIAAVLEGSLEKGDHHLHWHPVLGSSTKELQLRGFEGDAESKESRDNLAKVGRQLRVVGAQSLPLLL